MTTRGNADAPAGESEDLQKKIKLLDNDRKAYSGDTKQIIKRQFETLQALERENEKLKSEIQNTAKHSSVKHNIDHQNTIGHLTEICETLERKIAIESEVYEHCEKELAKISKQTLGARKNMGGVNVTRENNIMVDKQIRVLENRLDQALVKFNEALAYNKELREQIDNLRRERVVFDGIYKKLERELHEKKKQMADIIEKSNMYYEERDVATNELSALKAAAEKDMLQYEEHFRNVESMLEADKNLKETLKQSQRFKPGLSHTQTKSQAETNAQQQQQQQQEEMKRKAAKETAQQYNEPPKENFEEVIEQITTATGISDLGQLLKQFQKEEEHNFSMYNFVNDLNNEVERLEESIAELKAEYDKHRGVDLETTRQKSLKDLEEKLARTATTTEEYEAKTGKSQEQLNELKVALESIFTKLGCSLDEMAEMLGTPHVTETNLMTFLGIIEQRCNEMLQLYNMQSAAKKVARSHRSGTDPEDEDEEEPTEVFKGQPQPISRIKFIGTGPAVPHGNTNLASLVGQLPTTGDTFGTEGYDDTEDDRVLTQDELRQQTEQRYIQGNNDPKGRDPKKGQRPKRR
eukprot:TRINITY_DN66279_c6_g1_i1.p1 TRINITY_DN66279_c6_g1~~TRINITY_DN66279_c6_g1_i1.p1  ORF type:complete len:579 (-),score=104.07 TRINITY_DN66279_c6_g1_i1:1437-3173(-)